MKIKWLSVILFLSVHFLGGFLILRGADHRDFFEMLIGIVIMFSPVELYPKMYEENSFCKKHQWNFKFVQCHYCKYEQLSTTKDEA